VSLLIGLAACVLSYFLVMKTKFGYETRVIGENKDAARYAGINSGRVILIMALVSGGFAGMAGAGELLGIHHHLTYPQNISAGYGFGQSSSHGSPPPTPRGAAFRLLPRRHSRRGGRDPDSLKAPAATVNVFNGVITFFLISGDYFLRNRREHQVRKKSRSPGRQEREGVVEWKPWRYRSYRGP